MANILVTFPIEPNYREILEKAAPTAEFLYCTPDNLKDDDLKQAEIIIGNIPADMLKVCDNLKWMQLFTAGTDGFVAALSENTVLTNATGAYGLAISEYLIAYILMLMKNLHLYYDNQKAHKWAGAGPIKSIYGSKVLVMGLGDIGSEFAKKIHGLGAEVYGIRRNKTNKPDYLEGLYQMDGLDNLLPEMDVVVTCLPNTSETQKTFDARRFALMKKGAIFVNIGRGVSVDTDALTAALESGHLGGAAVDVTDPEPLPADHPLWDAPNAIVTPHISGFFYLQETFERMLKIVEYNLKAYFSGQELKNVVDFKTGYRKFTN